MEPSRQLLEFKRLLIVVDNAADLNFHWQFALKDLLADIVRFLHPEGSTSQNPGAPRPSLGLIVYGSQGPCTEPQVHPWGWTYDLGTFLQWLSAVTFTSGEFSEAALAAGLSSSLQCIAAAIGNNEVQCFGRTHCILVTLCKSSSNDEILDSGTNFLRRMDRFFVDASLVARKFFKSFVSLSVISPTQSSRLKEIFRSGNVYQRIDESCNEDQADFNYLVLLSDNFKESHDALSYRDFIVEPAGENDKGKALDFGTYSNPTSKDKSSGINRVFGAGPSSAASHLSHVPIPMTGEFLTEVLPINHQKPSLVDILTETEVRLLEDSNYGNE